MEPETLLAPLLAVMIGNGLTFGFLYAMWCLSRDGQNWRAMLGAAVILLIPLSVALSLPR